MVYLQPDVADVASTIGRLVDNSSGYRCVTAPRFLSTMDPIEQVRHRPQTELSYPRQLVVACVPMRSNVNISTIARTASACGVQQLVLCGNNKLISKIARDGADELDITVRRTLLPALKKFKDDGYRLVGVEQTTNSQNIHEYSFEERTLLVVGNERLGIADDVLAALDDVVEIPVYGLPHSFNAATATSMAIYEYCRQFAKY